MGTTTQKLQKALDSKDSLKVSINNKGGNITDDTPFSEYSTQVDNLPKDNSILHSILNRSITEVNDDIFKDYYNSKIGAHAFSQCVNLTTLSLNTIGLTMIDTRAFSYCTKLENVNIPRITNINDGAFEYCNSLTSFDLSNCRHIGASALSHCQKLENITIGTRLTDLSYNAFAYCPALKSITIPKNIINIGGYCFQSCSSLSEINFEDDSTISTIGSGAFAYCTAITTVTIPSSVVTINGNAFYGCTSLEQIIFKGVTPPTFGSTVFGNCTALQEIRVPSESVEAYKTALGATYADLVVADE